MTNDGLLSVELVKREPVSAEFARKLIDYLIGDEGLKPGERLPSERQLAEDLGIGRSPVREGLKLLAFLGVIEVRHGSGSYIKELDSQLLPRVVEWGFLLGDQKVMEIVEARKHIEVVVAQLAASRREAVDLKRMGEHLKRMAAAKEAEEFVEADVAFHLATATAARNAVFHDVLSGLQSLLRAWISRVMQAQESFEPSYLEHQAVFDAIASGNADAAGAAMLIHMNLASSKLLATLADSDQ